MHSGSRFSERLAPTRLLVVRHGRVHADWNGRLYGARDVPLSRAGEDDAREAARKLAGVELAAVVSSGLTRTEFGARCLRASRPGLTRRDEPDLRELERGAWNGLTFAELAEREPGVFERWLADPGKLRPPGGESLEDLSRRVLPRVEALAGEFAGRTLALVVHSWVGRLLVCRALELPHAAAPKLDLPPGGVLDISWPLMPDERATLGAFVLDDLPAADPGWQRGSHRT